MLHIQDPGNPETEYLVDKLVEASCGAKRGGGAFAFLSAGGIRLLLRNEQFSEFLERSEFNLLAGVDAITDMAAIAELKAVQALRSKLLARVFIPNNARSIFHPKFAWFDTGNGGVLITGSGNLTLGGLRTNIEAFSVQRLDVAAMAAVQAHWNAYLTLTRACQLEPTDPIVSALLLRNAERRKRERAAEHRQVEAPSVSPIPTANAAIQSTQLVETDPTLDLLPSLDDSARVLVAEIPRSGSRWRQANFNQASFFGFFGASKKVQRQVYFFHVHTDGTVGMQEVRPAVIVRSRNYRFELDAAAGLDYPDTGKPIGVFAQVAVRTFAYMLLMPGSADHERINALLDNSESSAGNNMRRIIFSAKVVKEFWPTAPLWKQLKI